jgi:hypothetical protein|tara:strand:- start:2673 stop:2861 length:189 start_codon:yes stop_codon:yes gene_type:complete
MNKIDESIQIVGQLKTLMEKERQKWLKKPKQLIYYSILYQDTTAVKHMLAALSSNLEAMKDE